MIDFTDCRQLRKTYNGANGGKRCIEYICCHIYEMLGIPVQETLLCIV